MLKSNVLLAAMSAAAFVIAPRNTIPVLSNVLLEATGDRLRITSTDLDVSVEQELDAPDIGDWSLTAPAAGLLAWLKTIDKEAEISFTPPGEEPRLIVRAGRSIMRFPVIGAEEFPRVGEPGEGLAMATTTAADIRPLLKAAVPYMMKESRNGFGPLCGLNLSADPDVGLTVAASDGRRLFQQPLRTAGVTGTASITLPRVTATWLAKFMPEAGDVSVQMTERSACIDIPGVRVVTKVIDAAFPVFTGVDRETIGTVPFVDFRDAVDLVATVSRAERDRPITLRLSAGELTIIADTYQGYGETVIAVAEAGDRTLELNFSSSLLLASMKVFRKGETLAIEHGGDETPIMLRSLDRPDVEALISPIRTPTIEPELERPQVRFEAPDHHGGGHFYRVQVKRFASQSYPEWRYFSFPNAAAANRAYRRHVADARVRCDVTAEPLSVVIYDRNTPAPCTRFESQIPTAGYMPFPNWYLDDVRRRERVRYEAEIVFSSTEDGDPAWTRDVFDRKDIMDLKESPGLTVAKGRTKAIREVGARWVRKAAEAPAVILPAAVVAAPPEPVPAALPAPVAITIEPLSPEYIPLTLDQLADMERRAERLEAARAVFEATNDNDVTWTRKILELKLRDAVEPTPMLTVLRGRTGPIRALGATALKRAA
jgi:DNA polymerase-3 subunit beta